VDSSLGKCWDCPEPFAGVLPVLLIGIAMVAVGCYLSARSHVLPRNTGRAILIVSVVWYVLCSLGLWRNGIVWSRNMLDVNRLADGVLLVVWYALTLYVAARLNRVKAAPS
jgi:hypothetical protein